MATVITPGGRVGSDSPLGRPGGPGLFKVKGLKLPRYIRIVANGLLEHGQAATKSEAIRKAVGYVRNFAEGHTGQGQKVSPQVQAAAAAAMAEWEKARATAKSIPNKSGHRNK